MGNKNTTQNPFQSLKDLPTSLSQSQCVLHKYELLICGGYKQRACYSYNTKGHCVVKLADNNNNNDNQITLLSFGGYYEHTFVMKYVMVGGRNNHLLFITYLDNNISVFDLNTFQFIKHDKLLIDNEICYHCFVSRSENVQRQKMIKTNQEKIKQNYQMLLFCEDTGLSIEYDEDNNTFQFHKLPVCNVEKNNKKLVSKSVHKYSIQENTWITFKHTLPIPLYDCFVVLNEDNTYIHVIGGSNTNGNVAIHMKAYVFVLDSSQLNWIRLLEIKLGWINDFDKIIIKYNI
ncbi:hypothetical protein RFI_03057 [Reticulomyxa filosa]|uniref:Kelch motif family protein n=1 Tax=Reticulomyxa filosa TaxID=46433 RepID=X6P8Q6_RETFI|nr:hypothetical protein RFI_03057 [Reticulomyxa filosa]|eukprot:ETO34037.1 hypothetical protein RFI_03057 [Reticulomyxa filosa]